MRQDPAGRLGSKGTGITKVERTKRFKVLSAQGLEYVMFFFCVRVEVNVNNTQGNRELTTHQRDRELPGLSLEWKQGENENHFLRG